MSQTSTVKRQPPEIREMIADLRAQGVTIDAIMDKLRDLGAGVSRSAVGRYVKEIEQVGERIRRSREIADVLVKRLGDAPESRQARLNIELMHSIILQLTMAAEADGVVSLEAKDVLFLTSSLNNLASAQKHDAEFELKIRRAAVQQATAVLDKVAKAKGLSAETVATLKSEFLGIAKAA
jgi:uncharacterized NAD(P)/FAD-binding protein YdhS